MNRHVVNVNPAAHRGLPRHLVLADLHDGVAEAGCWNIREVASSRTHEVEVGNRHATASFPDGVVAVVVVGVGHEHVPLTIDHVRVEVVWAGGVVGIVPRINPRRVGLVRDVDERDRHLSRVAPFTDVRIGVARVNELILLNDVLSTVVFEVLHVKHLRVRVVVDPHDRGVVWVGHIDNVHVVPTGKIGVGISVGRGGDLNFSVSGRCQRVEVEQFHVVATKGVLASVLVVVAFALNQRIVVSKCGVFHNIGFHVVSKDQHRRRGKKKNRKDTKKNLFTAHGPLNPSVRLVFMIW